MKNRELITKALEILRDVMAPYLCDTIHRKIPDYTRDDTLWWEEAVVPFSTTFAQNQADLLRLKTLSDRVDALDIQACCNVLEKNWPNLFVHLMNKKARSWNKLVQDARNDVSHIGGTDLTDQETASALDNIGLLAGQMSEKAQAEIQALYRTHVYGSEHGSMASSAANAEPTAKSFGVMQTTSMAGLPSWRKVIEPHPDVAQGRYKNAEFAADLDQVARGEGAYEYRDPVEFFSRTYVTEGMKGLLVQALRRVADKDGEPVIQLKTAFGGGKTHSMLALYHLMRGRAPKSKLPNIQEVLKAAEVDQPPICSVAVLVGTALDPTKSRRPNNMKGITINTLWGEMAAQLAQDAGNLKLYDLVKESDKKGVSPGKQTLKELFDACGPCVILIDELVAYARKLYNPSSALPAGTFENLLSFIQEVTEAARASKNSLVVASIPESNIEIGGEAGQKALEAIEHTFGRMEAIWKPVAANEGFEIVRRRLFLPCKDEEGRDEVCRQFSEMYQANSSDFPMESKEVDYFGRLKSCYPIHPEIFDRLYNDWATIERFQKTRGVLRLMAAVVHNLWINADGGLLIMPGSLSLDESNIRDELTRHVGDNWNAIIDHEVDGKSSIPYQKDKENPRFGQVMAARRVARTIMLGSAPSTRSDNIRGLEASRIRLGTVQPGENIAIFNDALSKLQTSLSYLYSNPSNDRFWYDTRPTLRKIAEDRASQRTVEEVEMEMERRLHNIHREQPFGRIHICPASSMDVSDETDVGLVILKHNATYKSNTPSDSAIKAAEDILNNRGLSPRIYRNMLAFVAPDQNMMIGLREQVRRFLAWKSIKEDSVDLNLDAAQNRETENNLVRSNQLVDAQIQETYCHLLVPYIDREVDLRTIVWDVISLKGSNETIVSKAAKKMQQNEQLIVQWAPMLLKMQLDNLLWQDKDQVNIGDLWKMFCSYCYLPRLSSFGVLSDTIQRGVNSDEFFAYAEGLDGSRYVGLKHNQYVGIIDASGYVVKLLAALKQLAAEKPVSQPAFPPYGGESRGPLGEDPRIPNQPSVTPDIPPEVVDARPENTHFYMTTTLDNTRVIRHMGTLMDEVINHLMSVDGANIEIKLLVDASMPDGTPVPIVRTVTENCRTLHVEDSGFQD